jgi:hypothetical protein
LQTWSNRPTPDPDSGFVINFESSTGDGFSVRASGEGTPIELEPQFYQLRARDPETLPTIPGGIEAVLASFSPGCFGSIESGQEITCTITNLFKPTEQIP